LISTLNRTLTTFYVLIGSVAKSLTTQYLDSVLVSKEFDMIET
jgi:hypothetical protein